jgi:CHAD domain-containing protein
VKIPLTSATWIGDAARTILERHFEKLRGLETAVRAQKDVEAVHDMRVACRRTKSAFRLLRAYLPKKRVKKLIPTLDALRDVLGAARNLDVLCADLETYRATAPAHDRVALERVLTAWRDARAENQIALTKFLDSPRYAEWTTAMQEFLDEADARSRWRVADVFPALLWKQYGKVRAYETRLDTAALEDLHALRIDIKRLRYALEFFREPLSPRDGQDEKPEALIELLIALQDHLGSMQDAVVAGRVLTEFIAAEAEAAQQRGGTIPDLAALAAYQTHLENRIAERRHEVPTRYTRIVAPAFREMLGAVTARL